MGFLGAPPFLQTLGLLESNFLPRFSWSLSLLLSWEGTTLMELIRSGCEGSLPVWRISSREKVFSFSVYLSQSRALSLLGGVCQGTSSFLQGRGSSAGVPVPPQRRRTHCTPWLGDNSSSSARTVPPPSTVSQPWGGQHGVRRNGFHHCPLGLEDFRKTLHTLLSEVRSEYHGRATLMRVQKKMNRKMSMCTCVCFLLCM